MPDNALLIRRAQRGDPEAFEALVSPIEKRIYALCLRMLSSREDALDCAQDAMLRIWRAMPAYRRQASFQTWCLRIAANACLDVLRRRKTRPSVSLDGLVEAGYMPREAAEAEPHARAEQSARAQALGTAVAALPEDMRVALVLRDMQGLSYEEVSGILDVPLGTVKSRINRARAKVRENLGAHGELFGRTDVHIDDRRKDV